MQHPTLLSDIALMKHQENLQKAEQERLYRELKGNHPGLFQQIVNLVKKIEPPQRSSRTRVTTDTIPVFNK